jgi:hypothetical protein
MQLMTLYSSDSDDALQGGNTMQAVGSADECTCIEINLHEENMNRLVHRRASGSKPTRQIEQLVMIDDMVLASEHALSAFRHKVMHRGLHV